MGIIVDAGEKCSGGIVKKILLSDNKWYEVTNGHFIYDAFELGEYNWVHKDWRRIVDMGLGFECTIKGGVYLKGKVAEIKAFITTSKGFD